LTTGAISSVDKRREVSNLRDKTSCLKIRVSLVQFPPWAQQVVDLVAPAKPP